MSPTRKPTKPIDIYVRVSQVAGREGESFQSPADQEDRCRAQLKADGLTAGQVFPDLDVSGGKMSRPEFEKAMTRVRSGASGGIIVARLNRFGRTVRGVLDTVAEIESHGAVFISCEEKLDTSTSTGRFVLQMFAALAELELARYTEQWANATDRFLARGGHGGPFTPAGYDREVNEQGKRTGRLVPNEDAPAVREAFAMRARGTSLPEVAAHLSAAGVKVRAQGDREAHTDWTTSAVSSLMSNTVYLGIARSGGKTREGAHEALVPRKEFKRAKSIRSKTRRKTNGERSEGSLLAGLVRCEHCGGPLTNDGTRYRCHQRARNGAKCDAKPVVNRAVLEPFVEERALEFLGAMDYAKVEGSDDAAELELALTEAEEEFAAFLKHAKASMPGYAEALALREEAALQARRAFDEGGVSESWMYLSRSETVETYQRMTLADKRRVLAALIKGVTVTAGRTAIDTRAAIEFQPHPLKDQAKPDWLTKPIV